MTSIASYTFYKNAEDEHRSEGAEFYRVFVSSEERKIDVHWAKTSRDSDSETLNEKTIRHLAYEVHTNQSGESYLRVFNAALGNGPLEVPPLTVFKDPFPNIWHFEVASLIQTELFGWFYDTIEQYMDKSDNRMVAWIGLILFPCLRDETLKHSSLTPDLEWRISFLEEMTSSTLAAMRESSSWNDFIRQVACPKTVRTEEDIEFVKEYPQFLLLSTVDLGQSIRKARAGLDPMTVLGVQADIELLRFMFAHLPQKSKGLAWKSIKSYPYRGFMKRRYMDMFSGVPANKKEELADNILSTLLEISSNPKMRENDESLTHYFLKPYRTWYWYNVTKPRFKDVKVGYEQVNERFSSLFGTSVENVFNSNEDDDTTFFQLPSYYRLNRNYKDNDWAARSLITFFNSDRPLLQASFANGYVDKQTRQFVTADIFSFDDVLAIINGEAALIDAELTRLGYHHTPINRVAYISMAEEDRECKDKWKLYNLGVTDLNRVRALSKVGILQEQDVSIYNQLPDEMFYELVYMNSNNSNLVTHNGGYKHGNS